MASGALHVGRVEPAKPIRMQNCPASGHPIRSKLRANRIIHVRKRNVLDHNFTSFGNERVHLRGAEPPFLKTTTMSSDATKDLSISDLLRLLSEKLDVECARLRETPLPATSLKSEVSAAQ